MKNNNKIAEQRLAGVHPVHPVLTVLTMIKIVLKIDDASFRKHISAEEETDPKVIHQYIMEEILEGLGTACLDTLPDLITQGIKQPQYAEFTIDIRDTYEDLPLPVGED